MDCSVHITSIHHLKHTLPIFAGGGENPPLCVNLSDHIFRCNDLNEDSQESGECDKRGSKDPTQELGVSDYMPILLLIEAVLVENVSEITAPIAGLGTLHFHWQDLSCVTSQC